MKSRSPSPKRIVRYFISYTRDDGRIPDQLLAELMAQLAASEAFDFVPWRDTAILPGENWHNEIQQALTHCDFGLLLLSPAFLGNSYVIKHELPRFVTDAKPFIPVMLRKVDFTLHDLRGLQSTQLFGYAPPRDPRIRSFQECSSAKHRTAFAHELFKRISARLAKLYRWDAIAPEGSVSGLPRLQPFFGRTKELRAISESLRLEDPSWGKLIDGPGGYGKTALAVRAAELAPAHAFFRKLFFSAKQYKIDAGGSRRLANFSVTQWSDMINEIARAIGREDITKSPKIRRASLLCQALAGTRTLLILDNLEVLRITEQAEILDFVENLPRDCKVLLTCRPSESLQNNRLPLGPLSLTTSLRCLAEIAKENHLLQQTSRSERKMLYENTGGNPLLLHWVARQLGRGKCRTIGEALSLLRGCPVDNDPLEFIFGDLLAGFDSYQVRVLATLAYPRQPIDAKSIAALNSISVEESLQALFALANRAVIESSREDTAFSLVPMVGDFLRRALPDAVYEAGQRLTDYVYGLVLENGDRKSDRFPLLDSAWPLIAAALPLFLRGENVSLQRICEALRFFLDFTGRWDEWLTLSLEAEARAIDHSDYHNAGSRAYQAGWVHFLHSNRLGVFECATRAARHWHRARAGAGVRANAHRLHGIGHRMAGNYPAAIRAFRRAVQLSLRLPAENADLANALNDLADAEQLSGDYLAAERDFNAALKVAKTINYREAVAAYTGNLSELALAKHDWVIAESHAREALVLSEDVHRRQLVANNCRRLAIALSRQDRQTEGLRYARRAVEIYSDLHSVDLDAGLQILRECEAATSAS